MMAKKWIIIVLCLAAMAAIVGTLNSSETAQVVQAKKESPIPESETVDRVSRSRQPRHVSVGDGTGVSNPGRRRNRKI